MGMVHVVKLLGLADLPVLLRHAHGSTGYLELSVWSNTVADISLGLLAVQLDRKPMADPGRHGLCDQWTSKRFDRGIGACGCRLCSSCGLELRAYLECVKVLGRRYSAICKAAVDEFYKFKPPYAQYSSEKSLAGWLLARWWQLRLLLGQRPKTSRRSVNYRRVSATDTLYLLRSPRRSKNQLHPQRHRPPADRRFDR